MVNILNKIKKLNKDEHYEIFKIINKNNIKYTENSNGVFIDYNIIPEKVLMEIENFLKFSEINKKNLDIKEQIQKKYMNEIINTPCIDNIKKLKKNISIKKNNPIVFKKKKTTKYSGLRNKIIKKIKETNKSKYKSKNKENPNCLKNNLNMQNNKDEYSDDDETKYINKSDESDDDDFEHSNSNESCENSDESEVDSVCDDVDSCKKKINT
jgi:hypothetical protein